jgi:hypothetical protein
MKARLIQILRNAVGSEVGFIGEGNSQWYYFLYVIMTVMLVWRNNPAMAPTYTATLAVEYIIVCVYGYFSLIDNGIHAAIAYLGILLVTSILYFVLDWKIALLTGILGFIGQLIAPDESGQSFLIRYPKDYSKGPLIQNTLWFAFYVYVVVSLPVDLVTKLLFIIGAMLVHPLIDLSEGACMCYIDNVLDSIGEIQDFFDERRDQKYQNQKHK